MSEEHARQFVHATEKDALLQQKIDTLNPATVASDIVKLGAERGLLFSVEELNTALTSHLQPSDQELSEDELSSVAGGIQGGTFSAPYHPNTNASGVPHPAYWVKHGSFTPEGLSDITPKAPPTSRPANGQVFFSSNI